MYLKRIYDHGAPKEKWSTRTEVCTGCDRGKVVNAARDGVEDCPICLGKGKIKVAVPPVKGIKVLRAGRVQRFTQNFITGGLLEGWLFMGDGLIVLRAEPEALTYRVVRGPGAYCCFCDESVPGGQTKALADESLAHVAQAHSEEGIADPHHPAGYRVEAFYTTVLEKGEPIELPEAAAMDRKVRDEMAARTRGKYGAQARRDLPNTGTEG